MHIHHGKRLILRITLIALALAAVAGGVWLLLTLPDPRHLEQRGSTETLKIYDRNGVLLYEWLEPLEGKHSYVPLAQIPRALQLATIATEDASFYANPGVDWRGILRSAYLNLRYRRIVAGGSTITQQLARILLMSPGERWERSWSRKIREAVLALRITQLYSKDQILELYLNHSYYGNWAFGVQAAAEAYFGKHVAELDLAECALLAGLPQSPTAYNPLHDPDAARARQHTVLGLMVKAGYLDEAEAALAREEPLRYAAASFAIEAPHFASYVREQLVATYGLEAVSYGGWQVYTTLDLEAQRAAERIVRYHLARLREKEREGIDHNVHNAAVVALDPASGEILAMVGSPDYFDASIDGAVNTALAHRQPGSSIKPITYATALASGYTPATVIYDVRQSFLTREGDAYVPENYDQLYHGPISLRRALATSSNVAAVSVLDDVGLPAMLATARAMGLNLYGDPERYGLSLTLGGGEVRLLDLTVAYGAFATGGERVQPVAVRRIVDARGEVIYEAGTPTRDRVLDPRVAYLITDILADDTARIPAFGERSVLYLGRPAAVKTGTTTDWHDNWTIGYTPDLVVGVWAGNADNTPMNRISGVAGAAPIWHDVMDELLKGKPARAFAVPEGIVQVEVCAESGLLPNAACPHRVYEQFIADTTPTETCDQHRVYRLDAATGQPATADTPSERVVQRVFYIPPPMAAAWAREQGIPQPPDAAVAAPVAPRVSRPLLEIIQPDPNATYVLSRELPASAQAAEIAARWNGEATPRQITLLLDGAPLATLSQAPYRVWWTLTPGAHTVAAVAIDTAGQTITSAPLAFTVEAGR